VVHEYRDLVPAWLAVLAANQQIPSQIGMLCTDEDPGMDRFLPPVAHYRRNASLHASRLRTKILQAISGKTDTVPSLLNAEFIAGGSLGRRSHAAHAG
jgi:DNA-binding LacI/PurR family transcriptional regulator